MAERLNRCTLKKNDAPLCILLSLFFLLGDAFLIARRRRNIHRAEHPQRHEFHKTIECLPIPSANLRLSLQRARKRLKVMPAPRSDVPNGCKRSRALCSGCAAAERGSN